MRIVAGEFRGRQLKSPTWEGLRPTSDRLRETLFNILAPRIAGARFADLYAGSGAVGIEAISRGAAHVYFAERAAPAIAAIRANLASFAIRTGYGIEARGTAAFLTNFAERERLDLVFLDPPWEATNEYAATLNVLGSARGAAILAEDAMVIAEHSSKAPLAERFGALVQTRTLKQGDAALSFYRYERAGTEAG